VAEDDERDPTDRPEVDRAKTEDNSLARLLTLADGIFAIAMTLLALDLTVPDDLGGHPSDHALRDALRSNTASYLSYLLSFYVVALLWMRHRRLMRSVVTIHPVMVRDTLFLLVIVAAMPFFTSLLGRYGSDPISLALYAGANVISSGTLMLLSHDISRLGLTDEDATPDDYTRRWQSWYTLAVFVICIPGAYLLGRHGPYLLILLVVPDRLLMLHRLIRRSRQRSSGAPVG
jgi:uncharacterized membrane protein